MFQVKRAVLPVGQVRQDGPCRPLQEWGPPERLLNSIAVLQTAVLSKWHPLLTTPQAQTSIVNGPVAPAPISKELE
jgi:hypothetical protein